ncbi:hypothetical protein AMAG_06579 [Allomyces macrogynus ATCC 38327]|uniref:G-protein coupled receptors family 1 profile domain-containing protein n=1 Tax=Allomyces macrogynus (strain ATCC 38327) TaxID=578462 RepID=A0A0L0SGZ8_ALLM3|nr:hypothetical protein AMAG_06579 [Allomyces macrogynus ATCC 38327]|eukprot:KNE61781.1 hypothetical protein AMAG_06579 [Allomyces macrogynus ATCC 38327]
MGVTENVFYWSAASFLLGVTMTNFVTNIGTCIGMYRRRPSKFYLALLGVTICSLIDPLCVYVGAARMETDGYLWNVAACIVSLFGLGVFGTLNFVRFWRTCGPALPRLTKLLGIATLIHVSWYWIVVIWWAAWLFSRMSWNDMDDLFFAYSLWYVYDSIVNLGVSLAFVLYLRSKLVTHGAPQRPGVQRALRTVQLSLAVECLFLLVSNVMNAVDKTTDPLWGLSYLGGSIRLRVFCTFLGTIRRIMKNDTALSTGHTSSGTGSHTGSHGGYVVSTPRTSTPAPNTSTVTSDYKPRMSGKALLNARANSARATIVASVEVGQDSELTVRRSQ